MHQSVQLNITLFFDFSVGGPLTRIDYFLCKMVGASEEFLLRMDFLPGYYETGRLRERSSVSPSFCFMS